MDEWFTNGRDVIAVSHYPLLFASGAIAPETDLCPRTIFIGDEVSTTRWRRTELHVSMAVELVYTSLDICFLLQYFTEVPWPACVQTASYVRGMKPSQVTLHRGTQLLSR